MNIIYKKKPKIQKIYKKPKTKQPYKNRKGPFSTNVKRLLAYRPYSR